MLGNADYARERNYIFCSKEMAYALHLDTDIRARRAYSSPKRIVSSKRAWDNRIMYYVRTGANFAAFDPTLKDSKLTMTSPKPLIRMVKDRNFVSMETRDGGDVVLLSRDETVQTVVFCNFSNFARRVLRKVSTYGVPCRDIGIGTTGGVR